MSIVRLDKIKATAHLVSGVAKEDLKNGVFVAQGKMRMDGDSFEVDKIADLDKDVILFHASVPQMYETSVIDEFSLKTGRVGRFYMLEEGDIISVSDDMIEGTIADDKFVVPQVGKLAGKIADALTTEKLAMKVIAREQMMGTKVTVLQVVRGA